MTNKSTNPLIQNNFALKKLEVGLGQALAELFSSVRQLADYRLVRQRNLRQRTTGLAHRAPERTPIAQRRHNDRHSRNSGR